MLESGNILDSLRLKTLEVSPNTCGALGLAKGLLFCGCPSDERPLVGIPNIPLFEELDPDVAEPVKTPNKDAFDFGAAKILVSGALTVAFSKSGLDWVDSGITPNAVCLSIVRNALVNKSGSTGFVVIWVSTLLEGVRNILPWVVNFVSVGLLIANILDACGLTIAEISSFPLCFVLVAKAGEKVERGAGLPNIP